MEPKVSIVIVTWNGGSDLRKCLISMQSLDYPNYDITVVDNASSDGTCEMLRDEFPYVRLIGLQKNVGRSEGLNIGTAETDGEFVAHLDNDIAVTDTAFLTKLVALMAEDDTIGACGPMVLDEGSNAIQATGGNVDFARVTSSYHPWVREQDLGSFTEPIECDYIVGCAVLFRRSDLDQVGHYDSRFVVYWDDVDICVMIKKLGKRIVTLPTAKIVHKVTGSAGIRSSFAYFHGSKNRIIFMRKHGKLLHWPLFLFHLIMQPWPGLSKKQRVYGWRIIYPSLARAIWWNLNDSLNSSRSDT